MFYNIILGALVVASNHWVLIGSNDLHRFWDVCYVGHADNIKKHLWFRHIVTSNVSHGYVILIARIDGAMRRKTQSVSQLDVHISLREMQSFAYSPLSGIPYSLRTWIFDPRRVSTSTSWLVVIFYVHMEIVQFRACVKNGQICTFWGVPPKMVENAHFGGGPKTPHFGGIQFAKNPFRGAQLYGDTRQIIYCLDTRYGTPKPCFWCQNTSTRQNRGFWENRVFCTFFDIFAIWCIFGDFQKWSKVSNYEDI